MSKFKLSIPVKWMGSTPRPESVGFYMYYRTKEAIVTALRGPGRSSWSEGKYFSGIYLDSRNRLEGTSEGPIVRMYSLEKHRRKMKVVPPRPLTKSEKQRFYTKDKDARITREPIIPHTYWTAVYYDIPESMLKFFGIRVVQGNRTFTVEKVKEN